MCAKLANLNHCAVPFLSRAAVILPRDDSKSSKLASRYMFDLASIHIASVITAIAA